MSQATFHGIPFEHAATKASFLPNENPSFYLDRLEMGLNQGGNVSGTWGFGLSGYPRDKNNPQDQITTCVWVTIDGGSRQRISATYNYFGCKDYWNEYHSLCCNLELWDIVAGGPILPLPRVRLIRYSIPALAAGTHTIKLEVCMTGPSVDTRGVGVMAAFCGYFETDIISFTDTIIVQGPEGKATISSFTPATSATAGQFFQVFSFNLTNSGGADTFFVKLTDTDINSTTELWRNTIPANGTMQITWSGTMPNRNWRLRIDVGHEQTTTSSISFTIPSGDLIQID